MAVGPLESANVAPGLVGEFTGAEDSEARACRCHSGLLRTLRRRFVSIAPRSRRVNVK